MPVNSPRPLIRAAVAGRGLLLALCTGALLAGCSSSPKGGVQVVDRDARGSTQQARRQPASSGQYVVQRGDTLYSIAFRFGWDWKTLAARNGIPAPYLIRTGQIIRFTTAPAVAQVRAPAPPARPACRGYGSDGGQAGSVGAESGAGKTRPSGCAEQHHGPLCDRLGLAFAGRGDRAFFHQTAV